MSFVLPQDSNINLCIQGNMRFVSILEGKKKERLNFQTRWMNTNPN